MLLKKLPDHDQYKTHQMCDKAILENEPKPNEKHQQWACAKRLVQQRNHAQQKY